MRKRVIVTARIGHPPERVFDYLADPTKWHEFSPAVVLRRQIDEGDPRIGTRWTAIDRVGPFKVHFTDELIAYEVNHRVTWDSSSPWNARTDYTCERTASGTSVRVSYEGDVDGWLRILSWAPSAVIGKFLSRDFVRLQARLNAREGS